MIRPRLTQEAFDGEDDFSRSNYQGTWRSRGKSPISLIDGDKLLDLLIENDIGISKKTLLYHEIDLDIFEEIERESDISSTGKSLAL